MFADGAASLAKDGWIPREERWAGTLLAVLYVRALPVPPTEQPTVGRSDREASVAGGQTLDARPEPGGRVRGFKTVRDLDRPSLAWAGSTGCGVLIVVVALAMVFAIVVASGTANSGHRVAGMLVDVITVITASLLWLNRRSAVQRWKERHQSDPDADDPVFRGVRETDATAVLYKLTGCTVRVTDTMISLDEGYGVGSDIALDSVASVRLEFGGLSDNEVIIAHDGGPTFMRNIFGGS